MMTNISELLADEELEALGREAAQRLGLSPTGLNYPMWPVDAMPLPIRSACWDEGTPYIALGRAIFECRESCGYETAIREARAEALEEAAVEASRSWPVGESIAAAILKLKETP